jgi:hypothetical protein
MTESHDIAAADRYIGRARRNIEKQQRRLSSRNPQTAATAESLVELLSAMLSNVERKRRKIAEHNDGRP